MKCHYEVLQLELDASDDEIRKAYRKLALKWHPDKNLSNSEEAKDQFQLIQQAYEVLSDPQERSWYDRHRDSILKGGLGSDYKDDSLNVYQYYTTTCFKGFGEDEHSFYTVYAEVFNKIAAEDSEFNTDGDSDFEIPVFGNSTSSYEEVVHPFYSYWQSYSTKKTYSWLDKFDIRDAPNRKVVRLMEKENKKIRDKARKERNEEVRALVAFVRKRDKRIQERTIYLEKKAAENEEKMKELKKKQFIKRKEEINSYVECEWAKFSNFEGELKEIEANLVAEFKDKESASNSSNSEDESNTIPHCLACNKSFKTDKAFINHENSKKHKENLERLREIMEKDDEINGTVLDIPEPAEDLYNFDNDVNEFEQIDNYCEEEHSSKFKKKKKKKSLRPTENIEIQQAHEVLSDSQDRWHDSHRDSILKGGLGNDYKDDGLNVYQYCTTTCFKGFGEDEHSFYSVYAEVFNKIAAEDSEFNVDGESDFEIPVFGNSTSSYEEVVHPFYSYWESYSTKKTYSWLDKFDIRDTTNRKVDRLMEKENKKIRDKARKERNEEVRALVAFVKKGDKRIQERTIYLEKKAAENEEKMKELKEKQFIKRKEEINSSAEYERGKFSNFDGELGEENSPKFKKKKKKKSVRPTENIESEREENETSSADVLNDDIKSDEDKEWESKTKSKKRSKQSKDNVNNEDSKKCSTQPEKLNDVCHLKCAVCEETFNSKNELFKHLRSSGHAVPIGEKVTEPIKSNKSKKKKK